MITSITVDIEVPGLFLEDVMLCAEMNWQDDSFSYAGTHCTGGVGGVHRIPPYSGRESGIMWNVDKYNNAANAAIYKYVQDNEKDLDDQFMARFEKEQMEEHEDDY